MNRRMFLTTAGTLTIGSSLASARPKVHEEEDVEPAEDLMREHGVLRRVMLVYEEIGRRLQAKTPFDPQILAGAAGIIRHMIEDYHEKLEEDYLFPRFEAKRRLTDLVATLRKQHVAGRELTGVILSLAGKPLTADADRSALAEKLHLFNRMYAPHAAREDTVLFPAFHEIVGKRAYRELG